jgi:dihydroorotase-like cyclic amidohydrolase
MNALSANPSQILGLEKGEFQIGKPISFTIADPNLSCNFSIQFSKTKNNPLHKQAVKGSVLAVYHKQKLNQF